MTVVQLMKDVCKELDGKVQQTHVGESRGERAAWRVIVPSRPSRHGWECRVDKKIRPEGDSNTRVQSTMPWLRLRVVAGHHLNHSVIWPSSGRFAVLITPVFGPNLFQGLWRVSALDWLMLDSRYP